MIIDQDYAIFLGDNHFLVQKEILNCMIALKEMNNLFIPSDTHYFYIGKFNNKNIYAIYVSALEQKHFVAWNIMPIREFLPIVREDLAKFILRAKQLINWHRHSLFCGTCGSKTEISEKETAKVCKTCKKIIYPYSFLAIIVLIEHHDKILLARSPHFIPGMYSTLAGFVEAGETCEDAVHREMKEEVGITVNNIRYFGSQSWPFPNSFMLGFKAQYAGGTIHLQAKELEDAQWFDKNNLPLRLPSEYSIARKLIDSFIQSS